MAVEWTTPITWTVGAKVTAAQMNAHIRDNSLYMWDPPRCAVRLTADQEVATSNDHTVSWSEAVWDSHGDMWDSGGPSSITITRAGVYTFSLRSLWESTASGGKRAAFLHKNGTRLADFYQASADGVDPFAMAAPIDTNAAVSDVFTVVVRQLSGDALDLIANRTVLTVRWVAAPPVSGE